MTRLVCTACVRLTPGAKAYDEARIWIGGTPFRADLTPEVEAKVRCIARDLSLEVIDHRPQRPLD